MVLTRSRLYCGCAIPVASHLLVAGSKDEWKPFWLDLLETLRWRVPADRTMLVMADRDLYAKWLYEAQCRVSCYEVQSRRFDMRIQRLTLLLVLALCFLLASCGTEDAAGTSSAQSSRVLPPIPLHNPSPRQLGAAISVAIGGYDRTTREMTSIRLAFGFHERTVQFAGNEHLMCNGTAIPLHDQFASFQIAAAPTRTLEGRTFTCTYSASGASATLTFTVPQAPAILSPLDQARVQRSTHTLITYEVPGGKPLGIVALGPDVGPVGKAIAQLDTPRTMQATVNTSAFAAGAGSIALTQQLAPQVTQTGVPFASLFTGGTAVAMIAVTWV